MEKPDQHSVDQLSGAIRELTRQLQDLQLAGREESRKLKGYKAEGTLLEFTLVTGGLVRGAVLWVNNSCIGVRTDSDQDTILYQHAIAFVQEQAR